MNGCSQTAPETVVTQTYSEARACHSDLGLKIEQFSARVYAVAEKHLGAQASGSEVVRFIKSLHTNDLYLSVACACHRTEAWDRFTAIYHSYIHNLAFSTLLVDDAASDLAASVLADMFLPDRYGHSGIRAYEGRSSLATWLRVIISHRALNERMRKCNNLDSIDMFPEKADEMGVHVLHNSLRAHRYEQVIKNSFESACNELTDRDRLILLFRFEQDLNLSQIARFFDVHPTTITRQLERVQRKIRDDVISILASKYNLNSDAIAECLADIMENPAYSILSLIKDIR